MWTDGHSFRILCQNELKSQMNTNRDLLVIIHTKIYVLRKQDHQKLQYFTTLTYALCKNKLAYIQTQISIIALWTSDGCTSCLFNFDHICTLQQFIIHARNIQTRIRVQLTFHRNADDRRWNVNCIAGVPCWEVVLRHDVGLDSTELAVQHSNYSK
jgi:hypothetical protein